MHGLACLGFLLQDTRPIKNSSSNPIKIKLVYIITDQQVMALIKLSRENILELIELSGINKILVYTGILL